MCFDFTNLNKSCPKDSFSFPRIDTLVDSTTDYQILNFMDAFSGYNQIRMHKPDQEKTTFITNLGLYCYKVIRTKERRENLPKTHQRNVQEPDRKER